MPGTRKLGRTTDSRKAMMRAMVTYLLENGKIETTVTRAKDVRSMAEKMITLGKSGDLHTKRQVYSYITKEDVAKKLFDEISPKYADRNGGYTRIVKIVGRADACLWRGPGGPQGGTEDGDSQPSRPPQAEKARPRLPVGKVGKDAYSTPCLAAYTARVLSRSALAFW